MLHNLDRRLREDLARTERSVARNGSPRIDRRAASEDATRIGRAVDVEHAAPPALPDLPDLPDLIDDLDDDVRTTIDVLPPEVRFALAEDEPGDLRLALSPEGPRVRGCGDGVHTGELRTVVYRQPSIVRPVVDVPLAIVRSDPDDAPTVIDRLPEIEAPIDVPTVEVTAPAADALGPPWRVTAVADELHFATERRSRIVIGSMPTCDWVLDHAAVRAVHCELVYDDGWFLSARAPVRFLGLDVQGWTPVASGDVIGLGGAALRLEFAPLDDAIAPAGPAAVAPVAVVVPAAAAPPPASTASEARSAAEDAVFRLPEAEDATAARVTTGAAPARRAVLGLVVLAALGGLYVSQRTTRSAPRRAPAAAARAEATAAPAAAPVPRPTVTLAAPALATRAEAGVAALLDGNHRAALLAYRRVAADGGGEAADIFVRALESRLAAPCRRAGRPIKECIP